MPTHYLCNLKGSQIQKFQNAFLLHLLAADSIVLIMCSFYCVFFCHSFMKYYCKKKLCRIAVDLHPEIVTLQNIPPQKLMNFRVKIAWNFQLRDIVTRKLKFSFCLVVLLRNLRVTIPGNWPKGKNAESIPGDFHFRVLLHGNYF